MKNSNDFFPIFSVFNTIAKAVSDGVQNPFGFANQAPLDIIDKGDNYLIKLALAGFSKSDIKIKKSNDYLVVTAEKQEKSSEEEGSFFYKESGEEKIRRTINLPQDADISAITAKMENGVLQIVVQKLKAKEEQEVEIG